MKDWKSYNDLMNEDGKGYNPYSKDAYYANKRKAAAKPATPATKADDLFYRNFRYTREKLQAKLEETKARLTRITDAIAKRQTVEEIAEIEKILNG